MEVDELRARCRRLVLDGDEDRRLIERRLHAGVQQELVALAIKLQLVAPLVDGDPKAARALLDELALDVQDALEEAAELAGWIFPPLLDGVGLGAALRAAADRAGIRATVEIATGGGYPPAAVRTVYSCWLEALDNAGQDARVAITMRAEKDGIAFEVVASGDRPTTGFERLRDRVEALDGRLLVQSEPGGGTRISGTLPVTEANATESPRGRGSRP